MGAYGDYRTGKNINLTILASGSEVNLAMRLVINWPNKKIYSSNINALPRNFDKQNNSYKDKILKEQKHFFN